jgi:hypothetical protein
MRLKEFVGNHIHTAAAHHFGGRHQAIAGGIARQDNVAGAQPDGRKRGLKVVIERQPR